MCENFKVLVQVVLRVNNVTFQFDDSPKIFEMISNKIIRPESFENNLLSLGDLQDEYFPVQNLIEISVDEKKFHNDLKSLIFQRI